MIIESWRKTQFFRSLETVRITGWKEIQIVDRQRLWLWGCLNSWQVPEGDLDKNRQRVPVLYSEYTKVGGIILWGRYDSVLDVIVNNKWNHPPECCVKEWASLPRILVRAGRGALKWEAVRIVHWEWLHWEVEEGRKERRGGKKRTNGREGRIEACKEGGGMKGGKGASYSLICTKQRTT